MPRKRKHGQIESEVLTDKITITSTTIGPGRLDARIIKNNTRVLHTSVVSTNPHPSLETYPDVPPNEMLGLEHVDDDELYEDEPWEPGKTESRVRHLSISGEGDLLTTCIYRRLAR